MLNCENFLDKSATATIQSLYYEGSFDNHLNEDEVFEMYPTFCKKRSGEICFSNYLKSK